MLFAKISHELRTPLNGITGMLATLIDEHDYDKRAEKIKVALRSADILLNIINEVLDFSKINHGWRVAAGAGGLVYLGLDYPALESVMRMRGIEDPAETLGHIQQMEAGALEVINQQ